MALALHGRGVATRLVLPAESAREAALAPGAELYGAAHRLDVVRQSCRAARHRARRRTMAGIVRCLPPPGRRPPRPTGGVKDHAGARRALEIAAAGQASTAC
jgi:magnesium chelatase family protein